MKNFVVIRGISPLDLGLALIAALLCLADQYYFEPVTSAERYVLMVCACALVVGTLLRRTYPVSAAVAVYVGALGRLAAVPYDTITPYILVLIALYAVVVYGSKIAMIAAIAFTSLAGLIIYLPYITESIVTLDDLLNVATSQAVIAAVATGGVTRRQQFARVDLLVSEARLAQDAAKQEAALAVVGERTRIAREMHDIVAHTLSVVIAQADGGKYAAATNPKAAEHSLEVISEMARDALRDIRSIIGVLRDPDDAEAPLAPQPVGADLASLTQRVRDSGHEVSYIQTGQARPLPVGVGNALYRICQEALTNSLKHAGPDAKITVLLAWRPATVYLEVTDNGRGAATPSDGKGHGIIGMNERAAMFGGSVVAGPRTGGGFKVAATIPTSERTTHV